LPHDPSLTAFSMLMQGQDEETIRHCLRLRAACGTLAAEVGLEGRALRELEDAALLHDIGMFRIAPAIRAKAGALSEEEWQQIHRHPDLGADLVGEITTLESSAEIVRSHHERWDGAGYPRGLAGEQIPLGARVLAVIDAFDSMCERARHRARRTPDQAREEIRRGAGSQFDPRVVAAFELCFDDLVRLREGA
jgi:HD-GYP domain-containing protein (c-di-GMP phosphodiesterase class II)